jgi:DNA modification methylase
MLLINGDCIKEMQKLIDDGVQVDSVVTDPPYHLQSIVDRFGKEGSAPAQFGTDGAFKRASTGFMGKEWDGGDIAFRKETWELAMKLLKPGGHLLAFSASRNYHRMAVAIEDAGFDIRDQMMWLYGSGFPKSLNIGKAIDKRNGVQGDVIGTRKVTSSDIGQKSGWNHLNTDRGDYEYREIMNEYEGWGTALKPAHEPIVMARKPLSEKSIVDNVLKHGTGGINIDGCRIPYGEGNEPIPQLEQGKTKVNSTKTMFDGQSLHKSNTEAVIGGSLDGRFPANVMHGGLQEGWARFFYCPKVSKNERNNADKNTHPTVKPVELMKYLCRLVTPKGGTVLDPFMGSGSTGMAAKDEGFDFIGIEKEKEYFEICESRINRFAPLMDFM